MPMHRYLLLICALALAGPLTTGPASPQSRDHEAQRQERRTDSDRSGRQHRHNEADRQAAAAAARRAQAQNDGGRVLSVDRADNGHRVRLLKDGEVRTFFIPD
jgi:Ni/Co efflux regulator RcnB